MGMDQIYLHLSEENIIVISCKEHTTNQHKFNIGSQEIRETEKAKVSTNSTLEDKLITLPQPS